MARFTAAGWIEEWDRVGSFLIGDRGRVSIVADLDGNADTQRRLLSKLDGGKGRRDWVRELALKRWRAAG